MKKRIYDWVPDEGQELILRSALSGKEEALECWEKWKRGRDIDRVDRGSYRMLPMVFFNLKHQLDKQDELYGKLKGTYRKSWFSNHMTMASASSLFTVLKKSGIHPLLLKGVHLISSYYEEAACRPVGDADFLVGWEEAERADRLMRSEGWRMKYSSRSPVFRENVMSSHKSEGYINREGNQCDLHWNIFGHRCYPGADDEFIARSEEFLMNGEKYRGLGPEDLLIHLLEHGAYGSPEPQIRWVPDLLSVIRKRGELDWDLVFTTTKRLNLEIPVNQMLEYVNDRFCTGRFNYLLDKLNRSPVSQLSREIASGMKPARTKIGHRLKGSLRFYLKYRIFMSEFRKERVPRGIRGFIRYLKFRFDSDNCFSISIEFFRRAFKIITGRGSPS